jgi:hypothetical protein
MTFTTKIPLVALDKSHVILVTNDKGIGWMKKSTNISSSFDSIVYVSHVTTMPLFWSLLRANDMLPHAPIFNYLKGIILLFWNSLGCSSHMFGLFILCHVAF